MGAVVPACGIVAMNSAMTMQDVIRRAENPALFEKLDRACRSSIVNPWKQIQFAFALAHYVRAKKAPDSETARTIRRIKSNFKAITKA